MQAVHALQVLHARCRQNRDAAACRPQLGLAILTGCAVCDPAWFSLKLAAALALRDNGAIDHVDFAARGHPDLHQSTAASAMEGQIRHPLLWRWAG